jgi:translocator protein
MPGSLTMPAGFDTRDGSRLAALGFFGATAAASALGRAATGRVARNPWYRGLRKPRWQPPRQAFPVVWTTLYAMAAVSGHRVWRAPEGRARRRALALWGGQLVLNAAWSPLFFRLRRPRAALADAVALTTMLGAYAASARRVDRRAAWLVVPYLGWSAFAVALNATIVLLNRRTLARR